MTQPSGPRNVRPDDHRPDGNQPGELRWRSYGWEDPAISGDAASLTDHAGRQYAYATSSCLIFRP
jgi:hypothetical protein